MELAKAYNRTDRRNPIPIDGASTDDILAGLKSRLSKQCSSERCWLGLGMLAGERERELELALAPPMPESWKENPTEWLSNEDIEAALKCHTAHHKDFRVLGVFPMDFMSKDRSGKCVSSLCSFRAADLGQAGFKRAAMVINTDDHTGSGQHWVSLFIHACPRDRRYGVYYFDSTGRPPTPEVDSFSELVRKQLERVHGPKPAPLYSFNDKAHQKTNTECGVFCINFIMKMLGRSGFKNVCSSVGDDMKMMRLRSKLFDPQ